MFNPEGRVLIVEDSPVMANQTASILEALGFKTIVEARNGFLALQKLIEAREAKLRFHLLIVDWDMPKLTGLEFYRMMRTVPEWSMIPAIFLTSFDGVDHVVQAASAGIQHYLIKPPTKEVFQKRIEAIAKQASFQNIDDLLHDALPVARKSK